MSTTYTTNYHLGKQTDTSDNFDMSVITDNMDIIDAALTAQSNQVNYVLNDKTVMSMTWVQNGYINSSGEIINTNSHRIYSMPLGSVREVRFKPSTAIATNLAYGMVKKENGSIRMIFVCGNTTNEEKFIIDGESTDTLYVVQYQLNNPSMYYTTFKYRDYELIPDIYHDEIEDIVEDVVGLPEYYDCINKPIVFQSKKLQFFGDSITYGYITGGSQANNNYPKVFSQHVEASSYTNSGESSSSLSPVSSYPCIYNKIQSDLDATADVIFIAGGINDWQLGVNASALSTAVGNICEYLSQNYTGTVVFITPINHSGRAPIITPTQTLTSIRRIITEKALEYGYNVVQGWKFPFPTINSNSSYKTTMFQDNLHPTELGYAMYAKALAGALL